MTQEVAQKPQSMSVRLVILGMLVGLAFGIWATVFVPRLWHGGKGGAVQRGVGAEDEEAGEAPKGLSLRDLDSVLPRRLTARSVLAHGDGRFTKLEFAGTTYWMLEVNALTISVPHKQMGLYAPDKDGVFHLSLIAESWAAASIEATVNQETGMLKLRERANSKLKDQLILSCNLRTIGTQHSTWDK